MNTPALPASPFHGVSIETWDTSTEYNLPAGAYHFETLKAFQEKAKELGLTSKWGDTWGVPTMRVYRDGQYAGCFRCIGVYHHHGHIVAE